MRPTDILLATMVVQATIFICIYIRQNRWQRKILIERYEAAHNVTRDAYRDWKNKAFELSKFNEDLHAEIADLQSQLGSQI